MARPPSLQHERGAWADGALLLGVDEVGRGPLAGPVVAAAIVFPPHAPRIQGIRDSKTLPAARREALAQRITARAGAVGIGAASVRLIDRLNIRVATALAMRRAITRALTALGRPADALGADVRVLIDGLPLPELGCPHTALVDGDALCYSVAAAGLVAKTLRDRLMTRLAPRYPAYAWASNMGYGTAEHLAGIDAHGASPHHRRSFTPVSQLKLSL